MRSPPTSQATEISRRKFLADGATVAAASILTASLPAAFSATPAITSGMTPTLSGRRKLGSLEVSAIGLGVQNMSRT